MGAISRGLEKIWNKKQFLLHSPLQLKLWLVPKRRIGGEVISAAALIRVNMVLSGITMVLSTALK